MASKANKALTTGLKILGGSNIPTYTLEFLTPAGNHVRGSYLTIAVPYAELGRDSSCTVRFGDDTPTISRKHAAIERKGDDVFIINLSDTNPTLVNGRPVNERYYLNNGDEIQLSLEGPRIRYNETQSGTATMGFTKRMNLVMQQAVRPYKTAATSILIMLLAVLITGGFIISKGFQERDLTIQELREKAKQLAIEDSLNRVKYEEQLEVTTSSYLAKLAGLKQENINLGDLIADLKQQVEEVKFEAAEINGSNSAAAYQDFKNQVYYMRVINFIVHYPDGTTENAPINWGCTGFLLNDGKFVTARHCIQNWRFLTPQSSTDELILNNLENQGARFEVMIKAESPNNQITFNSKDAIFDDTHDELLEEIINGKRIQLRIARLDKNDWAYFETDEKSLLTYNQKLSFNLTAGSRVVVMGYSYGLGGGPGSVSPLLSESMVAQDGINSRGSIFLTDRNFGQGNSGGPVLVKNSSRFTVIGIVSAGTGAEIGGIVPIGMIQ